MKLVESLAKAAGAAIGSSRPVAETLKYLPLNRYVGMSGQKFTGNLYIACGISGATQHLKGIKDASTIVAINKNGNAPIFKNCDYGIVGVLTIFSLIAGNLQSSGFTQGLTNIKQPTANDYNAVFWFNIIASSILYVILFFPPLKSARGFACGGLKIMQKYN